MSKYRIPRNEELVRVADGMSVSLPVGTKVWVKYEDTSCGSIVRVATVIETESFGRALDNGYGNPIFGIEWYAIAEEEAK